MKIKQFRFSADNFGYLVYHKDCGVAIDGGAPGLIIRFAQENGIKITVVTNTHSHHDHTPGNKELLDRTGAQFVDCRKIRSDEKIDLCGQPLMVWPTPGHTTDSVTFVADRFMVTGDTLFNGTVGNCFSGDLDVFYESLSRLMKQPPDTEIYAGHDYFMESMQEAGRIEPYNKNIDAAIQTYDPGCVVTTLADELKTNPYIRFNDPDMIDNLKGKNTPVDTERDRFKSIMTLY